jgi:hypothetical protein
MFFWMCKESFGIFQKFHLSFHENFTKINKNLQHDDTQSIESHNKKNVVCIFLPMYGMG